MGKIFCLDRLECGYSWLLIEYEINSIDTEFMKLLQRGQGGRIFLE